MKYVEAADGSGVPVLELTRRNLEGLLAKLDDPASRRMLLDPEGHIIVQAVENEEHYKDRPPGAMFTNGEFT